MNGKELYEKYYGEKKLLSINYFPFLRRIFKKYDLHRVLKNGRIFIVRGS
jgi:hypothetical protein